MNFWRERYLMKREQLGSRLGFIMLSAGCAIGCGNVWKFPWMCGKMAAAALCWSIFCVWSSWESRLLCWNFPSEERLRQVPFSCTVSWKSQDRNGEYSVGSVWSEILPWWHFTLLYADGSFIILSSFSEVGVLHWDFQPWYHPPLWMYSSYWSL